MDKLDPLSEYLSRLERWRAEHAKAQRTFVQLGNYRLLVALAAAALALMAFWRHAIPAWWLLLPLATFVGLVIFHERVARRQQLATRAAAYYERGLARLDDRWIGTGSSGDRFRNPAHVYADDLDLFGKGSLFELLSTARTAAGEQTLADWLLTTASRDEVAERQAAVQELCNAVQLREDLALLGEDVRAGVHAEVISSWGSGMPIRYMHGARLIALALAGASIALFLAFMAQWLSLKPFLAVVLADIAMMVILRKAVAEITHGVETPAHDLRILSLLLARLEKEQFLSPKLKTLRGELDIEGLPASKRIARLERWIEFLDSGDHLLVRTLGPAVLWREQACLGIEAWRRETGPHIGRWIAAIAELEALSSFAAYGFERPDCSFPLLVDGPLFKAEGLRHPLMSPKACVPNDVDLGGDRRLLIVSGSNMSGKSTLLRSVGLNTILAWAGAPVAARSLRTSAFQVGASIRIVDSLQDGKSRFYAEITRLRQIVDLTVTGKPALFLLDELLSGTNSHDRRIGAEAVVKTLVARGAVGFVTTHDLALTQIGAGIPGAANVHFEDHLEDGRISFDYKLKPGVVERSNALELMRAVGLEV